MTLTESQHKELLEAYLPVAELTERLASQHALADLHDAAARHRYEGRTGDYDHPVDWGLVFADPPTCPSCQRSVLDDAGDDPLMCRYCGFSIGKDAFEQARSQYELDLERRKATQAFEEKARSLGLTTDDLDAFYDRLFAQGAGGEVR